MPDEDVVEVSGGVLEKESVGWAKEPPSPSGVWAVPLKVFRIFTPGERLMSLFVFLGGLLAAALQSTSVFIVYPFISVIMNPGLIHENRWLSRIYYSLGFSDGGGFIFALGVSVVAAIVLSNLVSALSAWAKTRFVLYRNHALSNRLLAAYLSRPYSFFLRNNSSDLVKNVLAEVGQLTLDLLMPLFDIAINLLVLIAIVAMLGSVNPSVTAGSVAFLGAVYGCLNWFTRGRLRERGARRLEANRRRYRDVSEVFSGIKTAKVTGAEPYYQERFREHSDLFARLNVYARVVGQLPHYLMETAILGGLVLFVLYALSGEGDAAAVIPLVSLFTFAGKRLVPAIQTIYASASQIYYNQAILDKFYEDFAASGDENPRPRAASSEELSFERRILLDNIAFSYPGSPSRVVDGLTIEIPKGSVTGFAGPTGAGKTTLVDILLGLHMPDSGRIMADDTPLDPGNIALWQRKIGYVPQEIYLCDDTVRRNITFGIPENLVDEERVVRAARMAALDGFIQTLPLGYGTVIGERGVRLSGGQRQRVGLARALYRDGEILIFDEATSSIDGATEEAVLRAILRDLRGKTVIMVAHRLNTLRDCGVIYILEQGRITGRGTYDELLRGNKTFQMMAKAEPGLKL